MAGRETNIGEALDRLAAVFPKHAPDVWKSLRPGVSDSDLDLLRRAVAPYELTVDVCALLRWADGQEPDAPWWPSMECGPLLGASQAASHYKWLRENTPTWQWLPLWLPIAHSGWNQAGLEIVSDGPGVVVDASFPDPARVISPTLAAMLSLTADMVEAGIAAPPSGADARQWRTDRAAMSERFPEWSRWPYKRIIERDVGEWPSHWRNALGLTP